MKLFSGNSGNSILLAIVKVFSVLSGIVSTMIVSHALDLEIYGSYSQAMLIVATATSLSALGLPDAMNYFFNRTAQIGEQKRYINTIIALQCIFGIVAGLLIVILSEFLVAYFDNPLLRAYILLIAFRPLFTNVTGSLQHLMVSIGKAQSIAVRNGIFAVVRLAVFAVAAYILKDVTIILLVYLVFEVAITALFYSSFRKNRFRIDLLKIDWKIVKEIFSYCIPMGVYVLTNSLARDIDKMLIGGMFATDDYAIYANCSTLLPFDIVSTSFLLVLVPILTRYLGEKNYVQGQSLFRNYLRVGYYTSFTFTFACIVLSREMILFLYGEKYLPGQVIFKLYTIVDMVKFANMSIVLSASGKTLTLMTASLAALVGNAVLNLVFVKLFGYVGPAIATVVITLCLSAALTQLSAQSLHSSVRSIIDWKEMGRFVLGLVLLSALFSAVRLALHNTGMHYFFILAIAGGLFIASAFFINKRSIVNAIKEINALR